MRFRFLMLSLLGALLLVGDRGWSQEKEGARALLDKAIEAHGGVNNLKKWTAIRVKYTGKTFLKSKVIVTHTAENREDGTDHYYGKLESKVDAKTLVDIIGLEDDLVLPRAKIKRDDEAVKDLTRAELRFLREDRYFSSVTKLLPLLDNEFKLVELAEEVKIDDRAAVGILVKKADQRDVTLYFDKKSGLLLKSSVTRKWGEKEYLEEFYYSNHQEQEGSKLARKVAIFKDGKLDSEWTITKIQLGESFEPKDFEVPK